MQVDVVAHGRPATEALARQVARAKADRPLAPVTVIVPSNVAGLTARRLLAAGVGGRHGVANVHFLTPFRLAELLAADLLLDHRPLTNPVLGAAVRRALATEPGPFVEVADHQATEAALAARFAELSHVSAASLDALAAGPGMAPAAVRMYRAISSHLDGFSTEDDVVRAAADRPDLADALGPYGTVVWYLPEPVTAALARLLGRVLAAAPDAAAIVALTGADDADAPVLDVCARAGVGVDRTAATWQPPVGTQITSVTDADEEVRAVVRQVAALAEAGVPLDRITVFHPSTEPYVRTLQQQLAAAGIPANGRAPARLLDRVAGRTLLAALDLPGQRWRRDRVLALLAGGPVRNAHPAAWEVVSRQEGIVQGLDDWRRKLGAAERKYDVALAGTDAEAQPGKHRWLTRQRDDAVALRSFVDDLAGHVHAVIAAPGWRAKSEAATALLRSLVGGDDVRARWPEDEQAAAARVEDALSRLATLEELEPHPSVEVFTRALRTELDVPAGRAGHFGEGVHYGPLVSAVGHDLDAVFVLGLTEGQCPTPRRDDTMLPDSIRALAVDGDLPLRAARMHDEHRALLAALAAAPPDRRFLLLPRGDLRGGRHRLPSRWLLDTASSLAGTRIYSTDFPSLDRPVVDVVPSFTEGLLAPAAAGSLLDRDLAALARHRAAGGDPAAHPAAAAAARGLAALAARRSERFTEWDGNLAGMPVPSPARGELLSATRLERWAECGFRYFLADVLRLDDRDDPERIVDLSPIDRGSGVHKVLERFLEEVIADGAPAPDEPWSAAHRARVQELAQEVFEEYEALGRTGRPVHWKVARRTILALLDAFLTADDDHRARRAAVPVATELAFGLDDQEPVVVELADGRTIRFRGRADRVDATAPGGHVVSDYKTGKGSKYEKIDEGDAVRGGTLLQLGLYAESAIQRLGASEPHTQYWMVDEASGFAPHGYPWTADRRARFLEVVTAIVDGIEGGVFAAVPGEWDSWRRTHHNCRYCAFDDVCPRDRGDHADVKVHAPELRVRDVLEAEAVDT